MLTVFCGLIISVLNVNIKLCPSIQSLLGNFDSLVKIGLLRPLMIFYSKAQDCSRHGFSKWDYVNCGNQHLLFKFNN